MAIYDNTTGTIRTTLEELYALAVEWHIDEATDRDEAAVYARRFALRLLGVDPVAEALALTGIAAPGDLEDLERDAFDRLLERLPGTTRIAVRLAEHEPDDDVDGDDEQA